jgi:hypothetical protein
MLKHIDHYLEAMSEGFLRSFEQYLAARNARRGEVVEVKAYEWTGGDGRVTVCGRLVLDRDGPGAAVYSESMTLSLRELGLEEPHVASLVDAVQSGLLSLASRLPK